MLAPDAYRPHADPEQYIVRSTDEIWRDRGIGRIRTRYYAADCVVHSAYGSATGLDPVVNGTAARIASYPDRFSKAEDVVWEERSPQSFVSSHRVFSTGIQTGWNQYGPPTGGRFTMRALAHCLIERGRVTKEWLVRDEMRLALELGVDVEEQAERLAAAGAWRPLELGEPPDDAAVEGVSGRRPDPRGSETDVAMVTDLVAGVWNERMFDRTGAAVDPAVVLHSTRGRRYQGLRAYVDHGIDLLGSFPDAMMRILDVCVHDHAIRGRRIGVVWLLEGTYSGNAQFGPLTRRRVALLGSSQLLVVEGLVVEEFRVFDEMALRIQIEAGRLAAQVAST